MFTDKDYHSSELPERFKVLFPSKKAPLENPALYQLAASSADFEWSRVGAHGEKIDFDLRFRDEDLEVDFGRKVIHMLFLSRMNQGLDESLSLYAVQMSWEKANTYGIFTFDEMIAQHIKDIMIFRRKVSERLHTGSVKDDSRLDYAVAGVLASEVVRTLSSVESDLDKPWNARIALGNLENTDFDFVFYRNTISKFRTFCTDNNPPVFPSDTDLVLDALAQFVKFEGRASIYEQRRDGNLTRAQDYALLRAHETLTIEDMLDIYSLLKDGIIAGPAHLRSVEMQTRGNRPAYVSASEVIDKTASLLSTINQLSITPRELAVSTAAAIQCAFQHIHPIINMNGRLGHILTNVALVRMGQPTFSVPKEQYANYMKAVDTGIREEDMTALKELIESCSDTTPMV